jgi:hypothetical protein
MVLWLSPLAHGHAPPAQDMARLMRPARGLAIAINLGKAHDPAACLC